MDILSHYSFISSLAMLLSIVSLTLLITISPMSKILRGGILLVIAPFSYLVFFRFHPEAGRALSYLAESYSIEAFEGSFLSYHQSYFKEAFSYLQQEEVFEALFSVSSFSLAALVLILLITKKYLADFPVTKIMMSSILGLAVVISSYGLLLPFVVLALIFNEAKANSHHQTVEGKEALKDMFEGLVKIKLKLLARAKDGIFIHELLKIPKSFESRGIIIFGAPGSGKTHLIKTFYVPQFRKRGDMTVIFDYKGDFTEAIGEDDDALIISPLDERSAIWDIAKDINTETMAWEFGRMVVQKGDSPTDKVFEDWARDLITASLIKLQREKGTGWTFKDFYEQSQDLDTLIDAVKKYRKESQFSANFEGESKQFEGIKGTIRQAMVRLEPLSRAWGERANPTKLFSVSGWLNEKGGLKPTIIVRYDPLYSETMGPFVSNFLNFVIASVLSLPDAKGSSKDRRIWAVLDEFQILPKIPKLFEGGRAGRSKGLRMLLGTQDLGQTDQTYRKEGGRDTLVNLMGFKLIGHLGSEGMQNFAAGLLSKNKVTVQSKNVQRSNGHTNTSYSESTRYEPAISPGEFGAIPSPTAFSGSLFWMVHQGWHPVRLRFVTKNLKDKYEALIKAPWLSDLDRNRESFSGSSQDASKISKCTPQKKLTTKISLGGPSVKLS